MTHKLRYTIFSLLLLPFLAAFAQTAPKHEIRATWLTTLGGMDWYGETWFTPRHSNRLPNRLRAQKDGIRGTTRSGSLSKNAINEEWNCMRG